MQTLNDDSDDSLSNDSLDSSLLERDHRHIQYCELENFPVQVNCMELCNSTLDELLDGDYDMSSLEWKSILFQVCFGLSVAQKHFKFVHNDLHSSNLMFTETDKEFLYFKFKSKYFKIPTFGRITKIIDFGRATFNIKDKIFFSDVFKSNGDADGQYSYPYNNTLKNCKVLPNFSFDLSRLSTTIIENFDEENEEYHDIIKLLTLWATDKYGNCLFLQNDDFDLYKIIARNVVSAVPKNQINKMIFKLFLLEKDDIPKDEYVYIY